jgi:CMP/dCMP kinase
MSRAPVIAVDGPSGAGKGMVARALVKRLGWHLLDSGALYRVLALAADARGIVLEDSAAVAALAPRLQIRFVEDPQGQECILLDGVDVTRAVRSETTGGLASRIAAAPAVRQALFERQRAFLQPPGLVADGRDMGTVVFPDAVLKIFLDASPEERARRRQAQLRENGVDATLDSLFAEIRARDARDRGRAVAPLVPAADAVQMDTTRLTPPQVLAQLDALLISRGLL